MFEYGGEYSNSNPYSMEPNQFPNPPSLHCHHPHPHPHHPNYYGPIGPGGHPLYPVYYHYYPPPYYHIQHELPQKGGEDQSRDVVSKIPSMRSSFVKATGRHTPPVTPLVDRQETGTPPVDDDTSSEQNLLKLNYFKGVPPEKRGVKVADQVGINKPDVGFLLDDGNTLSLGSDPNTNFFGYPHLLDHCLSRNALVFEARPGGLIVVRNICSSQEKANLYCICVGSAGQFVKMKIGQDYVVKKGGKIVFHPKNANAHMLEITCIFPKPAHRAIKQEPTEDNLIAVDDDEEDDSDIGNIEEFESEENIKVAAAASVAAATTSAAATSSAAATGAIDFGAPADDEEEEEEEEEMSILHSSHEDSTSTSHARWIPFTQSQPGEDLEDLESLESNDDLEGNLGSVQIVLDGVELSDRLTQLDDAYKHEVMLTQLEKEADEDSTEEDELLIGYEEMTVFEEEEIALSDNRSG